jgi:hypothetical protein
MGRPLGSRNRPRPVQCSICGIAPGEEERRPILHFQMMRVATAVDDQGRSRMTTHGAGAIDLCERCWREATTRSAIRRRPRRAA